ncbi:MAG: 3'(2'),5'-bisphosphate nucleotidase CysQ [Gammaproteobacteria bacterium]|nr:3'(2'),5'-bisphosphate nucleotidase CysQ [Gammaproteobacteria bacterium]
MPDYRLQSLCDQALIIAHEAGQKILEIYNDDYTIEHKEDKTPLTTADLAAHHIIVNQLALLTPDIPVLSEESDSISFKERQSWQRYWLVDPLDGTREFIKRNGEFTVNIALIEKHVSILGVIYVPVSDCSYFAYKNGGAFKATTGQAKQSISARLLSKDKMTVAGSRSHASSRLQTYIDKLGDVNIISMGSSLKSCLVAEGSLDLYPRLGPTSEWDTAAAQCIVEQAGGFMTKTDMTPLRYNTKDSLLNPEFFVFGDNSVNWSDYL